MKNWKYERRFNIVKTKSWSVMLDFGIAVQPYWQELQTKGKADRLRSFPLFDICWDRMEFNEWGNAQGPAIKLPFIKIRFFLIK